MQQQSLDSSGRSRGANSGKFPHNAESRPPCGPPTESLHQ